ncbi:MAG: hypothetical protein OSB62_00485 [Alphaproteobacteria bacterium]|nr:hypothetical protein [Alphaproteobacteria bacterium]
MILKKLRSQKGAVFGLDARIALSILSVISVMAGGYYFANYFTTRAKALSEEFRQYGLAIDGYQYDMREDLVETITTPNGTNEITALFDDSVIKGAYQGRWNGPYLDHDEPAVLQNASTSTMTLIKAASDSSAATCTVITSCNYWIRLQPFPETSVIHLDEILDGGAETTPEDEGVIRWNNHADPGMVDLWYSASQAFAL